jgi:hypothetical protein
MNTRTRISWYMWRKADGRGDSGRVDGRRFLDRRRCLLQAGGRNGDNGDGDLEGWESAQAWVGGGENGASSCQTEPTRGFWRAARHQRARSATSTKGPVRGCWRFYYARKLAGAFETRRCKSFFTTAPKTLSRRSDGGALRNIDAQYRRHLIAV